MEHHAVRIMHGENLNNAGEWYEENYVKCSCGNVIWDRFPMSRARAEFVVRKKCGRIYDVES